MPEIGLTAFAVYGALAHFSDRKRRCHPSAKTLAAFCGMTTRSVWKAIGILERAGLIAVERSQVDQGQPATNVYTLLPQGHSEPNALYGVSFTGGSERNDPGVVNETTQGVVNETTQEPDVIEPDKKERTSNRYTSDFDTWWSTYPRKVGKAKAFESWKKAIKAMGGGTDATTRLLETTQRFAGSEAGQAGQYTPYPSTWLNGARYEDDPAEWNRRNGDGAGRPEQESTLQEFK